MDLPADSTAKLIADARDALQRRDGGEAQRLLEKLANMGTAEMPWLMLAKACNLSGDDMAEEAALQRQLASEPRNLPALLLTGEFKARTGDDRAAISFFQAALNTAAQTKTVPHPLHNMLTRAQEFIGQAQSRFEAHLLGQLEKSRLSQTGRVGMAIDLLLGRKQLYLQQPSSFYFPGLPQRQFYDRTEFDWLADVEASVPAMREELCSILADGQNFVPYVQAGPERPNAANPLIDDPSWGAYYFWQNGQLVADHADRCPATMAALGAAPMPQIDQRSPMALWSMLKANTHIQPHHGLLNTRLICHIPLMVPGYCALRVGNEIREWREGEALIFDDSFEHEAWNRSESTRVVLLFEIWRPEILLDEREALTAIFETINEYNGMPQDAG